ncbi:MAG: pirin family protein [Myxococcota bacterium]
MSTIRPVQNIISARTQVEGGGFTVRRPFPSPKVAHLDPLLLLDELGPMTFAPGEAMGAPDHPHRGIETVTYLLEGSGQHADSAGHAGELGPGDVQWMTAGAGIMHREMPGKRLMEEGGRSHGFQIWVNLPREHKMTAPRYQEIASSDIPEVTSNDGRAAGRLIAGSALGVDAPIETFVPVLVHHWRLDAGGALTLPVPEDHNVGIYVFEGTASVAGEEVHPKQLALLGDGARVHITAEDGAQFLLLGGRPINEPIAWGGPFVMNTQEEIRQAYDDFRAGRMGVIPPNITGK